MPLNDQSVFSDLSRALIGKKAMIRVYGCQMNVSDAERYRGMLRAAGASETDERSEADIIMYVTCCVRENAERRVFGNVGALRAWKAEKKGRVIAVVGCMPQQPGLGEKLMKRWPFVDLIMGTHNVGDFPRLLLDVLGGERRLSTPEDCGADGDDGEFPLGRTTPLAAFLPIMRGCDNFCSYCIVPYVRGRERSIPAETLIARADAMLKEGVLEITALGQNVNSYGPGAGLGFPELLRRLAELGAPRVRFMTSHPKDASDALFAVMAGTPAIAPHIHLPVQSGSDSVLAAMNRGYTAEKYLSRVAAARRAHPAIGITSDIIVGFPGETERDFEDTLSLVDEVGFDGLYMFAYSQRTGTLAATLPDQVPEEVKKDRLKRLIKAQEKHTQSALASRVGKTEHVLFVEKSLKGEGMCGRTARGMTLNAPFDPRWFGHIAPVRVTSAKRGTLAGEIQEDTTWV